MGLAVGDASAICSKMGRDATLEQPEAPEKLGAELDAIHAHSEAGHGFC